MTVVLYVWAGRPADRGWLLHDIYELPAGLDVRSKKKEPA